MLLIPAIEAFFDATTNTMSYVVGEPESGNAAVIDPVLDFTNVHLRDDGAEDAFVAMREARDATLTVPKLLLPAIQVNIRAGRFPEAEANGVHYLRIPVKFEKKIGTAG